MDEEYYKKMMRIVETQLEDARRANVRYEKQLDERSAQMAEQSAQTAELIAILKAKEAEVAGGVLSQQITGVKGGVGGRKKMPIIQSTGRYKEADLDILFDQVVKRVEQHISDEMLESNKTELAEMGRGLDVVSVFGHSELRSVFCTSYSRQLRLQLRLKKKDLEEHYKYTPDLIKEMKENHKRVTRWVNEGCKLYRQKQDISKIAESMEYKGLAGVISDRLEAKRSELSLMSKSGKRRTPEDEREKASLTERDKKLGNLATRCSQYFSTCGMFILYLEIMGIPIADADAQVFVNFQNFVKRNKPIRIDTVNHLRRDSMMFLTELATADATGYSFMPAIPYEGVGSIPVREKEIETHPEPPEVFWVELDERKRLRETDHDVRDIYRCIRINETGNDPELLEICLRFMRETGLRPVFAKLVEFGDFSKKPVEFVGKTKTPVYHFKIKDVKRFETGNKGIAKYNMFISELLWNQIQKYRKANPDIYDEALLFSKVKLLGHGAAKYETPLTDDNIIKDIFRPLSKTCHQKILPEKFRDSYYTLMLACLNVQDVRAFKDWTGDTRTTAETNYRGVVESVDVPTTFSGGNTTYQEIVTTVFNKEVPKFREGDLANPRTCSDGTVIHRKVYRDGRWRDSGQRC